METPLLTAERRNCIWLPLLVLLWGVCVTVTQAEKLSTHQFPTHMEHRSDELAEPYEAMYADGEDSLSVEPAEYTDGRSAYINNQFVSDDPPPEGDDDMPPLYELLQKQMEQLLASSGPSDVAIYETQNETAQLPPSSRPLFSSYGAGDDNADGHNTNFEYMDAAPSTSSSTTTTTTPSPTTTTTRTPTTTKATTTKTSTTTTTARPATFQPLGVLGRLPTANHVLTANNQKRHITFRTVASSTQVFVTPFGDLIFKYSIGMAKPTAGTGATTTTTTTTSSGSLTAPTDQSFATALALLKQLNRPTEMPKTIHRVTQKTAPKRRPKIISI